MHKPILHDTVEYLDKIVQIIESAESKNFIDTSVIISPAIKLFDPNEKKYRGYDIQLITDLLHYYYHTTEYNKLKNEILNNVELFEKNIIDLIDIDFMITPTIHKELSQSKSYTKDKSKSKTKILKKIAGTKKFYTTKYQKNGHHKAEYIPIYQNVEFSKEKQIYTYIKELLTIENRIAREVKHNSLKHVDTLNTFRLNNGSLYQKIYAAVNYAFEKFKEREKDSTKNQENSKDPRILSEIILYSHIFGEKINFFTADSDFNKIARYLDGRWIRANINPEVDIIQRMMQNPSETPYFEKKAKIRYNGTFIVER